MISNIDSNYDVICKLFNFSKETTADINKKTLLEMAKNGENKPNKKTKLGCVLINYTRAGSSYDPVFDKQIRKIRPDWFVTQSERANQNKKILIKMAKNGEDKPHYKTKLGGSLSRHTCKSRDTYDPTFDKQIRKLRLDWFANSISQKTAIQKQKILIKIAEDGEVKPNWKSKLGRSLSAYINKNSCVYKSLFHKTIKKLRPDWFVTQSERANQNKKILIKIAKNGEDKPYYKTKLGLALITYTAKSSQSFSPEFNKKIKKLRPDWFVTKSERANQNKKILIKIAKNGEDKPNWKSKLGSSLTRYTCKSCDTYDPIFTKQIKKLRSDWFNK